MTMSHDPNAADPSVGVYASTPVAHGPGRTRAAARAGRPALALALALVPGACASDEPAGDGSAGATSTGLTTGLTLGTTGETSATATSDASAGTGSGSATSSSTSGSGAASSSPTTGTRFDAGNSATDTASETTGNECASFTEMADNKIQPADILIVVDNSGSMDDEVGWVRDNLSGLNGVNPGFSRQITNSGIDISVVLISSYPGQGNGICVEPPLGSGGCPAMDNNPPDFLHINQEVGSSNGLDLALATHPQWASAWRPSAAKHVIIVTDDDATLPAPAFDAAFTALDPSYAGYKFHGIFAFSDPDFCNPFNTDPCCQGFGGFENVAADEGRVYKELVGQTMGVQGNLCEQNFQPVFDAVATAVIAGATLACEWDIPPLPPGESLDPDKVNVLFTPGTATQETIGRVDDPSECATVTDGWYYDDPANPTKVLVCPQTCARIQGVDGARIDIQFGCATVPAG
jgi:hypothetical protein